MSIVFASRHASQAWLDALNAAMPSEALRDANEIDPADVHTVDIAIVADPPPSALERFPNLRWMHSVWAGVERLVPLAQARNIPLVRLIDPELARTMAEAALAWVYYLQRDMPHYAAAQRSRAWLPRPYRAPQDVVVTVLGLGALGRAACRRLLDAGFCVQGWSRSAQSIDSVRCFVGQAGFRESLRDADIVLVLLPSTQETKHIINADALGACKPGTALINFARGAVLEADALVRALDAQHISHAVLDVFDVEPLPATSALWAHQSITILPHISAPTNRASAARIVAENIARYRASGVMPETVDLARGY
jgi:glyoxylate/hydroxypyruvate reductase